MPVFFKHASLRRGFSLIEMLVVLSLVLFLGAILFPAFSVARQNGQRLSCASNLRQLGLAFKQYREDFDGGMPITAYVVGADYSFPNGNHPTHTSQRRALWMHEIYRYIKSTQIYNCPNGDGIYSGGYFWIGGEPSYGFNFYLSGKSDIKYPAKTALIADCNYYSMSPDPKQIVGASNPDNNNPPVPRHLETLNMAFVDGHVKPVKLDDWRSDFTRSEIASATDPVWAKYDPRLQ